MARNRLFGTARAAGAHPLRSRWLYSAILIAVALAYVPFFRSIALAADTDHHAGHVVYVPVFIVVLLVADRQRLRQSIAHGEVRGAALTMLAMVILAVGYQRASVPLQGVSLVAAAAGLVWWRFGRRTVRALAFTLGFMVLMLPPPRQLVAALIPAMQQFVAAFAANVLSYARIPIERDGISLLLPGTTLDVVEECAGLRFVLIVFVFASAFGRLVLPTISSRFALVAVAVPVAILTNATRVAALSAGAHLIGPRVITGPLHFQIGRVFWALGLLLVIAIACKLRSWASDRPATARPRDAKETSPDGSNPAVPAKS
jgi:exosortase